MGNVKILMDDLKGLLLEGYGVSEIAQKLGVTKGAVSKRIKKIGAAINRDIVLRHAGDVVERKLDTLKQLQKINDNANELLDLLMRWGRGDEGALQILESQVRRVKVKGTDEEITEYRFKDPRELSLKAMAEIRGQLKLQFEIFQGLYDMRAVAEFQAEVLEAIGAVAPETRNRIVSALQGRRAIRSTLDFP